MLKREVGAVLIVMLTLATAGPSAAQPPVSSGALTSRAWEALEAGDFEQVMDLTEQCVALYGSKARELQRRIEADPESEQGLALGPLNDVATVWFIRADALQQAGLNGEAQSAYEEIVNHYPGGKCWDPRGWYWKPADVATDRLEMYRTGIFLDFGDHSSETLVRRAWEALEASDFDRVMGYTEKCLRLYAEKAAEMEAELDEYPQGKDEIFRHWALNDIATAHYIRGRALMDAGRGEEALKEFQIVREQYRFGQCWDPRGWFWKPAEAAEPMIESLRRDQPPGGTAQDKP